ncbi:MAG: DNA polymerase/3'-5' exonuclease PolX [Gemmatimonadales bacterium]
MIENIEIARQLSEVGDLLEIQEANPFRVRAYRNAVRTINELATPLDRMVADEEDLTALPGIGKELARHIAELVTTGEMGVLTELRESVPSTLVQIMRLPGVGPKSARKLWDELGVETVEELKSAAEEGRVSELKGFGEKKQALILSGIEQFHRHTARYRLDEADRFVAPLLEYLNALDEATKVEVAGSYRRRRETVGDIDILVLSSDPAPVMERFVSYPSVERVLAAGGTRGSVVLRSGLQVDLRIVPAESYGAALVYFTGSKEHNIRLRQRALDRGLTVSEYGVFELRDTSEQESTPAEAEPETEDADLRRAGRHVAGRTEEEVYGAVELPYILPELREARGEIAAAEAGELPELVDLDDLRGDLQMHSTWSDGKNSIEEMLDGCVGRGYEYFAITDHSKALAMIAGLDEEALRRQFDEIDEISGRHPEIRILRSMEVDILADGTLDLADEMLEALDLVVVSIHSMFSLPAARQTDRVVKALQHPSVDVLAHPTARLINKRDPVDFDLEQVFACAAENRVALELNANPHRLDLKDTQLMLATSLGAKVVISTDAHRVAELGLMRYGVEQARRAWLEKGDVLNALPRERFLDYFGIE